MRTVAVDFETRPVAPRPSYPPEPVGVAVQEEGGAARYYAWGHAGGGNDCSRSDALRVLRGLWDDARSGGATLLFHNAKFDLAVAQERMGLEPPPWRAVEDTMLLAYLCDPHADSIALKTLAEHWLGEPPAERDELHDWIWEHRAALRVAHGRNVVRSQLGAWIWAAPAGLVGRYACGDVGRTLRLHGVLRGVVHENRMKSAYDRERRVLPILMENERLGLPVSPRIVGDVDAYEAGMARADDALRERLRAPGLAPDNDAQMADVLLSRGVVGEGDIQQTATGRASVSKTLLPLSAYRDREVGLLYAYRNRLATCLRTFLVPWLEMASASGGRIHTTWNQTHGGDGGTRTGRLSTRAPSLLNVPKGWEGRSDGYAHPDFADLPRLPNVRSYLTAGDGRVVLSRDYSGQELRIFAHFEQAALLDAYRGNPALDPHGWLRDAILRETGREFERSKVKAVTFSRLYGGGRFAVARALSCSAEEASDILAAHDKALPGRRALTDSLTALARQGQPVWTVGGRGYFCEPARVIDGQRRTFDYKLINYLIQGSAADMTKDALVTWYEHPRRNPDATFMLAVHDELNVSAPEACAREQMVLLRQVMETAALDVPVLSEGAWGPSWGELTPFEDAR